MKIIENTSRKLIRYIMFRRKIDALNPPVLGKKKDTAILKFFEKKSDFTGWAGFCDKWDIGIEDDIIAKANRPEKWYLHDFKKSDIVHKPMAYSALETLRLHKNKSNTLKQT